MLEIKSILAIYLVRIKKNIGKRNEESKDEINGALEKIRTPGLPLRRGTLYPAELQAHY